MSEPEWHFNRTRAGDRARESEVEKFFRSEVSSGASALVREGIQNSLDAADKSLDAGSPVNVRIVLGKTTGSKIAPYCTGLWPHLESESVNNSKRLSELPEQRDEVPFLIFEDFNTTGLAGDVNQWEFIPGKKNPFFNFFRGEGVTDKGDSQRGRHGVGKMVFTVASRCHCVFGVTSTRESAPLLMGTSTLWLHDVQGKRYLPDGWFGDRAQLPESNDKLTVPVRDSKLVREFCDTFGLDREDIPGLSVVVPWIDSDYTKDGLIRAVIEGFFWPILQRKLTVEIVVDGHMQVIDAGTIDSITAKLATGVGELSATLALAKWALEVPKSDVQSTLPAGLGSQRWRAELLSDTVLATVQGRLDDGKNVAIQVPMLIRKKGPGILDEDTFFRIYMQRDPNCPDGSIRFIRNGLLISQVTAKRPSGYRALVVAEDDVISRFLGDAENPAHTEWQHTNLKSSYSFHKAALEYVVNSVSEIRKYLSGQQKTADPTLWIDLFFIPKKDLSTDKKRGRKPKKPAGGETAPAELEIKSKPKRWGLHKRSNGFVIGPGDVGASRPRYIEIRAAYEVRKGNPLKRYDRADFVFDSKSMDVDTKGVAILKVEDNRILAEVTDNDFRIQVIGFDTNRDVHVDVKPKDELPDDGEET